MTKLNYFLKKHYKFILVLAFVLAWSLFVYFVGARTVVEYIGIENGYLLIFLIAIFGGVSSATAVSFYTAVITLAAGGLNPFMIGLIGGIGVTFGDSIFYYLGLKGKKVIKSSSKTLNKITKWLRTGPSWLIQIFIFVYSGFSPFPNDILTVSLGLTEFPYRRVIIPLLLGDIASTTIVAYLAS